MQTNDTNILIPLYISKIGVFTSHFFLITSFYGFCNNYNILSFMILVLYFTSVLHWKTVYVYSYVKTIDIIMSISVLSRITLYDSHLWVPFRYIWVSSLKLSFIVFIINEIIFYQTVSNKKSILFTIPNTSRRELAYYLNVITHTTAFHFYLPFLSAYLAFLSKNKIHSQTNSIFK
jgi:hypothetical protein